MTKPRISCQIKRLLLKCMHQTFPLQAQHQQKPASPLVVGPGTIHLVPRLSDPIPLNLNPRVGHRPYMAGLGRFLTAARLAEQLKGEHLYAYAFNNPTIDTDPSGLNPQKQKKPPHSPIPPVRRPIPKWPRGTPCQRNTADYCESYFRTGNKFEQCACKVSGNLCDLIDAAQSGSPYDFPNLPLPPPDDTDPGMTYALSCIGRSVAAATLAQNQCMHELWQQKSTPKWQQASITCRAYGQASTQCCTASVIAEQQGYNICSAKVFKALGLLPYSARVDFALDVLKCCR